MSQEVKIDSRVSGSIGHTTGGSIRKSWFEVPSDGSLPAGLSQFTPSSIASLDLTPYRAPDRVGVAPSQISDVAVRYAMAASKDPQDIYRPGMLTKLHTEQKGSNYSDSGEPAKEDWLLSASRNAPRSTYGGRRYDQVKSIHTHLSTSHGTLAERGRVILDNERKAADRAPASLIGDSKVFRQFVGLGEDEDEASTDDHRQVFGHGVAGGDVDVESQGATSDNTNAVVLSAPDTV
eukprot:1828909-Amphidinium_carterae.1